MKQILSISLSLLILFGSMGFTMATHYCGGHAVSTKLALGNEHLDCGMKSMVKPCESEASGKSMISKKCCENKYQSLQVEDDYQNEVSKIDFDVKFIFVFTHTFLHLQFFENTIAPDYSDYSPPLLKRDIQTLFQSFLI